MNWQTFDNAPKDGKYFLACMFNGTQMVIRWDFDQEWYECAFYEFLEESAFTHWMPLPPGP